MAAAAEAAGGYVLAKTKMVKKEGKTIDGLYYGTLELEGVDEFAGNTYKLWFENEYHVMWKNGKPWITSRYRSMRGYKDLPSVDQHGN